MLYLLAAVVMALVAGGATYAFCALSYADWQKRERMRLDEMAKAVKR